MLKYNLTQGKNTGNQIIEYKRPMGNTEKKKSRKDEKNIK